MIRFFFAIAKKIPYRKGFFSFYYSYRLSLLNRKKPNTINATAFEFRIQVENLEYYH